MHSRLDFERPTPVVPKPRKMSTGGNRSWSEEEEAYLIQTRMQKMPYKHIAAHLKKTELACRLHYHQLSHGSHRRRRTSTSTTSSNSSNASNRSLTQYPLPGFDHNGFQTQTHGSPNGYHSLAGNYTGLNTSPGRAQHKILLPKPPALTPDNSPDRYSGLRIDTNTHGMAPNPVDADRLHAIYNSHRSTFWSAIAAEYGSDLSPSQLEDVWKHNPNAARRPPTPGDSPNSRAVHNILKPSPFPNFTSYEPQKDYSSVSHMLGGMTPPDRLPYPMGTTGAPNTYETLPTHTLPTHSMPTHSMPTHSMPTLPRLDRQTAWSNPAGAPPTSISTLLNDDKHSRQNDYGVTPRYH